VLTPAFNDEPRLGQRVEDLAVEQLISQLAVEALAIAVLPGNTGLDERRLCAHRGNPLPHGPSDEFRAIFQADMPGRPAQNEQIGQYIDRIRRLQLPGDPDSEALPGKFVDQVEHAHFSPIMGPALHEVMGPNMVPSLRPETNAGSTVQP